MMVGIENCHDMCRVLHKYACVSIWIGTSIFHPAYEMLESLHCRLVLADLEVGLRTLHGGDRVSPILVPDNPYHSVKYSVKQAETIILFNLWALSEIANTKSNLIGVKCFSNMFFLITVDMHC